MRRLQVKVWFQNRRTKHKRSGNDDPDDKQHDASPDNSMDNVDVDTYIDSPVDSEDEDDPDCNELNIDVI